MFGASCGATACGGVARYRSGAVPDGRAPGFTQTLCAACSSFSRHEPVPTGKRLTVLSQATLTLAVAARENAGAAGTPAELPWRGHPARGLRPPAPAVRGFPARACGGP